MIKAELNGNKIDVFISKNDPHLVSELNRLIAKGVGVLSEERTYGDYESAFYAMTMSAIDKAKEYGYKIDRKSIGYALMAYKD